MKKLLPLLIPGMFAAAIMTSCGGSSTDTKVEFIPVQLTEGGAWTFIDAKGEQIGTQQWEFEPTVTCGGVFTARTDSGLTVYRWSGREAKPIDSLQNLASVGVMNEGLMPVVPQMQRIKVVDADGDVKFVLEPINGVEVSSCDASFSEGMLIVTTIDGKTGVVNNKGEVVVAPKFTSISKFSGGYALAETYDYNNLGPTYSIIDKEGKVTPVKGKFGYSDEGDCSITPEFVDGAATVYAEPDTANYKVVTLKLTTDGKVSPSDGYTSIDMLANGAKIVRTFSLAEEKSSANWIGKDGKTVMTVKDDESLVGLGKFVYRTAEKSTVLYDMEGKELDKFDKSLYMECPGGDFGPIITDYDDNFSAVYTLLDAQGKPIEGLKIYGVGTSRFIDVSGDEIRCRDIVSSAYVDLTAAASKLASMINYGSVKGKDNYYMGQSVKDILAGENARFYTGGDRNFYIPTDSTGQLANGAGFWITGQAHSSASIVAPTYQQYFEVHHYDSYGRAWGWNRKRQTGVHFNASAKVDGFDLQLHTNHASGAKLREGLARHLKKNGYTLVNSAPNYDEYNNGVSTVIVYATAQSRGVGALSGKRAASISDDEKSALAATIY